MWLFLISFLVVALIIALLFVYWYVWRDGDESVGSMTYELKDSSGAVVASGTLKLDSSVQIINIGGRPILCEAL